MTHDASNEHSVHRDHHSEHHHRDHHSEHRREHRELIHNLIRKILDNLPQKVISHLASNLDKEDLNTLMTKVTDILEKDASQTQKTIDRVGNVLESILNIIKSGLQHDTNRKIKILELITLFSKCK